MRMIVSRGSMDLSRRDGAMPPDSVVQDRDTILADCERVIGRYHERATGRWSRSRSPPALRSP
jgi:8-oxoguanine deaminase